MKMNKLQSFPAACRGFAEAFGGSGDAAAQRMRGRNEDDFFAGTGIPFWAKVECRVQADREKISKTSITWSLYWRPMGTSFRPPSRPLPNSPDLPEGHEEGAVNPEKSGAFQ